MKMEHILQTLPTSTSEFNDSAPSLTQEFKASVESETLSTMSPEFNASVPSATPLRLQTIDSIISIEENEYLNILSEKELKAYYIAKEYLGTSFDLKKSNGFIKWKNNKK